VIMEIFSSMGLNAWLREAELLNEHKAIIIACLIALLFLILILIGKRLYRLKNKPLHKGVAPGCDQHIGSRKEQQDAFGFSELSNEAFIEHGGAVAVVADGMGGLMGGREASQRSVQSFLSDYVRKNETVSIINQLYASINEANRKVVTWAEETGLKGKTGTTLAAAVVHDSRLYWASAGDSRIYLIRDNQVFQVTYDHTYGRKLEEMAERGEISREEAENHPARNSLTSFLGLESLEEIDLSDTPISLQPNDMILLCSDGLYHSVTEEEMVNASVLDAQEAAEELIRLALQKQLPYQDNLTAVILKIS